MITIRRTKRYLWALPNTLVSLPFIVVGLLTGASARVVDGVLEVWGGALPFLLRRCVPIRGGALAMTLGHVVLGRSEGAMELTREHERVHVRQCERWGPFFIPAYFLAGLIAILRGGDGYRDNRFEREAFAGPSSCSSTVGAGFAEEATRKRDAQAISAGREQ